MIYSHMLKIKHSSATGGGGAGTTKSLAMMPPLDFPSFLSYPPVFKEESSYVAWLFIMLLCWAIPVIKLSLSQVLMCSAVKCLLQSSLPALSSVVFPVFWPSRSWLTSCVSPNWHARTHAHTQARFHLLTVGEMKGTNWWCPVYT